jgi:hypothetical protein
MFNGPIFDAPLCTKTGGGRLRLNPTGKRVKDGTFGGVAIPKQFYKVFVYRKDSDGKLRLIVHNSAVSNLPPTEKPDTKV